MTLPYPSTATLAQERHATEHPSPARVAAIEANYQMAQDHLHMEREKNRRLTQEIAELRAQLAQERAAVPVAVVADEEVDEWA